MIEDTEREIRAACNELAEMLIEKNRSYGDSAMNPIRIFSKAPLMEQLNVRMDDKISRLLRGDLSIFQTEDVEKDLTGYLILKAVAKKRAKVVEAMGGGKSTSHGASEREAAIIREKAAQLPLTGGPITSHEVVGEEPRILTKPTGRREHSASQG